VSNFSKYQKPGMNTDQCSFLNFQQIVAIRYGKILVDECSLCEILNTNYFTYASEIRQLLNVPSVQRP